MSLNHQKNHGSIPRPSSNQTWLFVADFLNDDLKIAIKPPFRGDFPSYPNDIPSLNAIK
jgi:hypothetical protein